MSDPQVMEKLPSLEEPTGSDPATVEILRSGMAVVRFRRDLKLNTAVIAEIMQERCTTASGPCCVVLVIPEHTEYEADMLTQDHFKTNGFSDRTTALAIVCHELGLVPLLRLYFAYYPPSFPVGFCSSEEEAKSWMRSRLERRVAV